jgi:uncharacterized membrane protein HdeD (DUF308 family)
MNAVYDRLRIDTVEDRWWMLLVRGVVAILFGFLAIALPRLNLLAIVTIWGLYALVDGSFTIGLALRGRGETKTWGWLLVEGIAGIVAGVLTFIWPGFTVFVLVAFIATWAVITGVSQILAAIRLRHEIEGEWLLATCGVVSLIFGVLLFAFPKAGALALVTLIGAYAVVFGLLLIALGIKLNNWRTHGGMVGHRVPRPI